MIKISVVVCGLVLSLAAALPAQRRGTPSSELQQLIDDYTARRPRGPGAGELDAAPFSLEPVVRDSVFGHSLIERANAIDTAALTHQQQLSLGIIKWQGWVLQQGPRLYWYELAEMPPYNGSLHARAAALVFKTPRDLATYLTLVDGAASSLDGALRKARAQAERGVMVSRSQVDRILPYYQQYRSAESNNPFVVDPARLAVIPRAMADSFHADVAQHITANLAPKASAIVDHLEHEVRQRGPAHPGLAQYPGGKEAYAIKLQIETTLPGITPEEVYERGLAATADVGEQLARIRRSLGFKGTGADFKRALERDKRHYPSTPADVARIYAAAVARIEPLVVRYFNRIPKAPYGVKRLNLDEEVIATFGRYSGPRTSGDTGYYFFNASNLDQNSALDFPSTIYHELIPGHHFHLALSRENDSLPAFRRQLRGAGFTEGWAEYASSVLAREAGMYPDGYDLHGRVGHDAIFAVRIVVDPAMNYYGWTRERAVDYMKEHSLHSNAQIESESWRYAASMPAQATAYRMGRDVMVELREKAQRELGSRFDIRRFHAAILDSGTLPLFLLQEHIDWWIQQESRAPER